jgi:group I intron endonuclease
MYIGQTTDPKDRKKQHFSMLSRNKHPNTHLQSSYNKYGKSCFVFEIIETLSNKSDLTIRESYWTEFYKQTTTIYNQRICVESNKGYKFGPRSEEVRNKISETHKKLGTKPPNRKGCKGYKLRKNENNIERKKTIKKLSFEAVQEIRKLHSEGNIRNKELSIMFGVHERTIRDVINNKTHKE